MTKIEKTKRPECLSGVTYKLHFHTASEEIKLFITICDHNGAPYEIFINTKNAQLAEHLNAAMILVCMLLQSGVSLTRVADELSEIFSPFTGHFTSKGHVKSMYAAIANVMKKHAASLIGNGENEHA